MKRKKQPGDIYGTYKRSNRFEKIDDEEKIAPQKIKQRKENEKWFAQIETARNRKKSKLSLLILLNGGSFF